MPIDPITFCDYNLSYSKNKTRERELRALPLAVKMCGEDLRTTNVAISQCMSITLHPRLIEYFRQIEV